MGPGWTQGIKPDSPFGFPLLPGRGLTQFAATWFSTTAHCPSPVKMSPCYHNRELPAPTWGQRKGVKIHSESYCLVRAL